MSHLNSVAAAASVACHSVLSKAIAMLGRYGSWPNLMVLESVKGGYRLPKPETMSTEVYMNVVLPCWIVDKTAAEKKVGRKPKAGHSHDVFAGRATFADIDDILTTMCCPVRLEGSTQQGPSAGPVHAASDEPPMIEAYAQLQVDTNSRRSQTAPGEIVVLGAEIVLCSALYFQRTKLF